MTEPDPRAELLRRLPLGRQMWLRAGGRSLWPLVRDGDQLLVERCGPSMLRRGDIAVVSWADQPLVAHLVEQLSPLVTTSTAGVRDAPAAEVLGRVVALRRGERQAQWPAWSADVLRWWPAASRLIKRVPGLREVVRRARDPY